MIGTGRSCYEANRQKRQLYQIGISLIETEETTYKTNEFSTTLVFNFTEKPLKENQKTLLLGFDELDEFLEYDIEKLYKFFTFRFSNYRRRIKKPIKLIPSISRK